MVDDRRYFSFVILTEGQLRTVELDEEIRFGFRINIEGALDGIRAPDLTFQLITFPPDCHFCPGRKRGFRRKFVVAGDGIQKFWVQLDGHARFDWLGGFGRLVGCFLKRQ